MIRSVSVIIPCYKQAHFLPECVDSLRAQKFTDWEAIIVDDGSPDSSEEVCSELMAGDPRVRYMKKTNGGLASARNAGLRIARGDAIQFLDADDKLQPHKLFRQVEFLNAHPEVDVVFGNARYFHDSLPDILCYSIHLIDGSDDWISDGWFQFGNVSYRFVERNLFPVCSPLIRRSVVQSIGDFDIKLSALEDWDYWWRCDAAGLIFQYEPSEGAHALIRVHGASMTHDDGRMDSAEIQLRKKHAQSIPLGVARDRNLDQLISRAVNLPKAKQLKVSSLLEAAGDNAERLHIVSSIALRGDWVGKNMCRKLLNLVPWRVRQKLSKDHGLRSLI